MLITKKKSLLSSFRVVTLLLFISLITFQSNANAYSKEDVIEDYRIKGYEEQQKGNLRDALVYYNKAIGLGLRNAVVLNDMGILYEQLGRDSSAERYYIEAIYIDKDYLPPYNNLAYLYKKIGDNKKAFEYFLKRYQMAPKGDPWGEKAKEELLKVNPKYKEVFILQEAEELNESIVSESKERFLRNLKLSEEYFKKGEEFIKEEMYDRALLEFERALKLTPDNPKIKRAIKFVTNELKKDKIKHHTDRAINLLNSGDTRSARREIQKMLATMPNYSK